MGKSSLINHFFSLHDANYLCIYCDIFDITTKEDLALHLLKSITNAHKKDLKSTIKNLLSLFKRVRVEPTLDTKTLEYSIKPIVTTLSFEEMMEDFFALLESSSQKQKIVLAIDEFQQIATLKEKNIDAMLRKFIQKQERISFVFLGSKRHLLTSLFTYKAPLYEMAQHFELPPLKVEQIHHYASKYLPLSKQMTKYIYEKSDGETKMIQNIFHILFVNQIQNIDTESIGIVIDEIINAKDSSYRLIYDSLNNNQKIALKLVAKYKKGFFTTEVLTTHNIKKQTLQSAINALFSKELIDKEGEFYFIPDRTLEIWAQERL